MQKKAKKELKKIGGAIEDTILAIQTKFGEGAIMKLGDTPRVDIDVIPTGSIGLDVALGVGGIPRGRMIEIFGPESSGKTTLSLHIIAEAQKKGWNLRFHRCRTCNGPSLCKKYWSKGKRIIDFST